MIIDDMRAERPFNVVGGKAEFNSNLPPILEEFFTENSIGIDFSIILQKLSGGRPKNLGEFINQIPSNDNIASIHGLGQFRIQVTYLPDGAHKKETKYVDFVLEGLHYEELHKEYKKGMKQKHLDEIENDAIELAIRQKHGVQPTVNGDDRLMAGTLKILEAVGDKMGGGGQDQNMIALLINQMNESNKNNMTMLIENNKAQSDSTKNMMTLFMAMMGNKNGDSDAKQIRSETMSFFKEVIDVKQALNPPPETVGDKLFKVVEGMSEPLMALIARPLAERQANPMVEMAKQTDIFKQLATDPDSQIKFVNHCDSKWAPTTTDKIIESFGFVRPEQCPRPVVAETVESTGVSEDGE